MSIRFAPARGSPRGGAFEELRGGPVEAAIAGGGGKGGEVSWLGAGGGGPEIRRQDLGVPIAAAVLVEVGGHLVQRRSIVAGARRASGVVRAGAAGADAGQGSGDTVAQPGGVGEGLIQPVVTQLTPFGVGQVAGGGALKQGERQVRATAQAPGVHRRPDERPRARRRPLVAV